MKIKEVDRTANVAWSPASQYPIYLATGTAAQQLDASFSTKSCLEIYELNLQEPGLEMNCRGSLATDDRFHKVVWGGFGVNISDATTGVLVAGSDAGNLFVYDPNKLIVGESESLIFRRDKHSGPVQALDFNPFQTNLLASGASDSEILIWDLNNPNSPMTPGAKSQPADDITCIAWNRQVQHILASTFSTRCVVWDLRKNEPIIKVSGSTSRMSVKVVAWHPEVATQMCLASEDDHTPFIQLWDLRFATSPLKTMENHQRGVLSLAWCPQDPDLLLSCGKDSHIVCWNPNSSDIGGEIVCEIPTSNQWSFDVAWCPRNPGLISSCSFDGHVSVYSLMGGQQHDQPSSKVAEAFLSAAYPLQAPSVCSTSPVIMLRKPPKWLKRPVGASFGFGGKLVSFEYIKQGATGNAQAPFPPALVHISQVMTDPDLVSRASQLESVLETGNFSEFCEMKVASSSSPRTQEVWRFLQANFHQNPKSKILSLLGHEAQEAPSTELNEIGDRSENQQLTTSELAFDDIAKVEGLKWSPATDTPFVIPLDDGTEGAVSRLLLCGKLEAAVDLCLKKDHMMEALLLAMNGGSELLQRTQQAYFKKNSASSLTRLVSAVVMGDWNHLVSTCSLESWKEALAGALVYSDPAEFPSLCEILGSRIEAEKRADSSLWAMLCYICAGNVAKLVECWAKATVDCSEPAVLQELVEQVTVLRRAAMTAQGASAQQNGSRVIEEKLCHYSEFLASQGKLSAALIHLQFLADDGETVVALRDRLNRTVGSGRPTVSSWEAETAKPHNESRPKPLPQQPTYAPTQQPFSPLPVSQRRPSANDDVSQIFDYSRATSVAAPSIPAASRGHLSQRYPHQIPDTSMYGQPATYGNVYAPQPLSQQSFPVPYSQTGIQTPSQPVPSYSSYDYQDQYVPAPVQYTQPGLHGGANQPPVQPYHADVQSGWNDPPPLVKSQSKTLQEYEAPAPITHPLFGVPEAEMMNYPPHGNSNAPPMLDERTSFSPNVYANLPSMESLPPRSTVVHQEPPKPRGPIPAEHQVLHDAFEELKNGCIDRTSNMQTKRKLDEVSKKLEVFYNKLRDNELSPSTLLGLHQIVQVLKQQQNYPAALHIHSQIVAAGAFSEICSFMPALKLLLQTAYQLAVSVQ